MQVTAEEEIADLLGACLPELDEVEAAFIQERCIREPKVTLKNFSRTWGLSAKAISEVQKRALLRLKDLIAEKGINSLADIV
jgi:DNA-directed RNA polymerase sigma subunit (sigma70/sigma32)